MIQNLNDNSTNRTIILDKKDWKQVGTIDLSTQKQDEMRETLYYHVVPNSEAFSTLEQVEAWIDRNKNQMTLEDFCRELLLRLRNSRAAGYNLEVKQD